MNIKRVFQAWEAATNSAKEAKNQIESVRIHTEGYAEPGYSGEIVATGDWNNYTRYVNGKFITLDDTPERLGAVLEKLGVELEWCDEWEACTNCNKLVRKRPDSYSWTRSYYEEEGCSDIICHECVAEDNSEYIEYLEGNSRVANTLNVDLTEHGYIKLDEDYENGLYGGQNDSPQNIAEALENAGVTRYIFEIDSVGQFDVKFSVFVHESEMNNIDEDFSPEKGEDPALVMKRNLQEMSSEMSKLPNDGIKYGYIENGKGTARNVSPEEFVKGIKK